MDLKDHFSRDATREIESLFLISKSNCAFVNYRTEAACTASMTRFHDSRFHGVRLVCRLRRSSVPNAQMSIPQKDGMKASPHDQAQSIDITRASTPASTPDDSPTKEESHESALLDGVDGVDGVHATDGVDGVDGVGSSDERVPEKYFVVKSLTMQDLDASVRNGVWATQSHNEEVLNKAFKV